MEKSPGGSYEEGSHGEDFGGNGISRWVDRLLK